MANMQNMNKDIALRLAEMLTADEWPGNVTLVSYARECVAELRRIHAYCQELESQLAQRFDAADVATASAQGFRGGVASLSANAGEPRNAIDRDALIDTIAQGLHGTWHCTRAWEAWHVGTMSQDDFEPVDESETPTEIADAVLALLAAPPAAQAQAISVEPARAVSETVNFTDQSTVSPIEKARRYLTHVANKKPNNPYFFDDGYPRESVADDAAAALSVLEQLAASHGQAPAGAYTDSTPHLKVGDSSFESWYAGYVKEGTKGLKQHCRDAYAAGMGDPLVGATPTPQSDSVQEDAACWHWIAEYLVGPRTDLDDEIVASETINELRKLVDDDLASHGQAPAETGNSVSAQTDSVQEDAARYRGLRNKSRVLYNQAWFGGMSVRNHYGDFLCREDALEALDKAIDAACKLDPHPASRERVYAFRRKGLADFCTCDEARYEELSNKPNLFETRVFYTAPQPSPRPRQTTKRRTLL